MTEATVRRSPSQVRAVAMLVATSSRSACSISSWMAAIVCPGMLPSQSGDRDRDASSSVSLLCRPVPGASGWQMV